MVLCLVAIKTTHSHRTQEENCGFKSAGEQEVRIQHGKCPLDELFGILYVALNMYSGVGAAI